MRQTVRAVRIATEHGSVTGLLCLPADARTLLVLAHGAGAGMRHRFFETLVPLLGERGLATLRYQFPSMEAGRRRPDAPAVAEAVVRDAVIAAEQFAAGLPLLAGGKSFGGRMTSQAQAGRPLPGVRGIVFLGFPLQAARRRDARRAEHLRDIRIPLLFVQGSRDALAPLDALAPVVTALGPGATLHVVAGGDHSYAVLKASGRVAADVLVEVAEVVARWSRRVVGG